RARGRFARRRGRRDRPRGAGASGSWLHRLARAQDPDPAVRALGPGLDAPEALLEHAPHALARARTQRLVVLERDAIDLLPGGVARALEDLDLRALDVELEQGDALGADELERAVEADALDRRRLAARAEERAR